MQNVYWSDVRERTIHRIRLDHTNRQLLLHSSRGIGVVDGINGHNCSSICSIAVLVI